MSEVQNQNAEPTPIQVALVPLNVLQALADYMAERPFKEVQAYLRGLEGVGVIDGDRWRMVEAHGLGDKATVLEIANAMAEPPGVVEPERATVPATVKKATAK